MPPKNADPVFIASLIAMYEESKGRDVAFIEAARWGALDDVVRLHQAGVNVNCRGGNNETALGTAAFAAEVAVVRFLLAHGADVSLRTNQGRGVLLGAVGGLMPERLVIQVVKLLLDAGANVDEADDGGRTAYSVAKPKYSEKVCGLLQPRAGGS